MLRFFVSRTLLADDLSLPCNVMDKITLRDLSIDDLELLVDESGKENGMRVKNTGLQLRDDRDVRNIWVFEVEETWPALFGYSGGFGDLIYLMQSSLTLIWSDLEPICADFKSIAQATYPPSRRNQCVSNAFGLADIELLRYILKSHGKWEKESWFQRYCAFYLQDPSTSIGFVSGMAFVERCLTHKTCKNPREVIARKMRYFFSHEFKNRSNFQPEEHSKSYSFLESWRPEDISTFLSESEAEATWKALYWLRNRFAHGRDVDFHDASCRSDLGPFWGMSSVQAGSVLHYGCKCLAVWLIDEPEKLKAFGAI